ncbi:MAG: rhomboid family intramembrane serine protease [Arenicella sp.]|jgi:membrane associated rhomboid family serine protease|nr:rhomboid family intramembrane serine protease [Arenicella sp.]
MNTELLTATNIIVAITCLVSFTLMDNRAGKSKLIFHPVTIKQHQQWYRFITSGFIHADTMHLAINMFVLWSFGNAIESYYYPTFLEGSITIKFLFLYFGGVIVASIPSYQRHKNDSSYAALGASGGVSAVVFAAIMFAPWQNLYLYGIIAIPQILAGVGYLYYSWVKDKNATDNIGHMAHFTGAIWGFMFTGFMNFDLFGRFVDLTLRGPSWL